MKRYETMTKEDIIESFSPTCEKCPLEGRHCETSNDTCIELIQRWLREDADNEVMTMAEYVHKLIPTLDLTSVCPSAIMKEWEHPAIASSGGCDMTSCADCWSRLVNKKGEIISENS